MTDTAPSRLAAKDLITLACAIVSVACVVAGVVRRDGQTEQRVIAMEARLGAVEGRQDRKDDLISTIDVRTARIETMLKMAGEQQR